MIPFAQHPRARWFRAGTLVAFATATAIYNTCPPVADNDLWGHLYFGRVILANGLPATNLFSYTAPDHPWTNHEVLAECAFAFVFDHLGSPGLLALKLLVGLATFGLSLRTIGRRTDSVAATALSLAACGSLISPGFLIRPQIFTFLGLALLWERLNAYDETRDWRSLVWVPLLFVVWTNTHGGVAAGIGVFLCYVTVCWLSPSRAGERAALTVLALLSVLALLVNPYGADLVTFLWQDLGRSRAISEWDPIPPFAFSTILYEATLAAILYRMLAGSCRRTWEWVILAVAAAMTFRHQRHLPLYAILAAPMLAETLDDLGQRIQRRAGLSMLSGTAQSMFLAGLCAITVFEIGRVVEIYRGLHLQILVSPDSYPVDAVRFMKRNRLSGNLAVQSDWGEYAIWHLYPRCRVSFDGRYTTAYPEDVLDLSHRFQMAAPGWKAVLDRADLALVNRQQRAVVAAVFEDPRWQYVYSDPTALVFIRTSLAESRNLVREPRTASDNAFFFP